MNKVAALIAMGVGGTFLALEVVFPYRAIFGFSVEPFANASQSKARAAVSSLLFDPNSAVFDGLRNVEAEGAPYVCGDMPPTGRVRKTSSRRNPWTWRWRKKFSRFCRK
jgi:hypothetical protein